MNVKLLTEHHLDFLSFNEAAQARMSLRLSKCHIVENHMSWLNCRNRNEISSTASSLFLGEMIDQEIPMIYI